MLRRQLVHLVILLHPLVQLVIHIKNDMGIHLHYEQAPARAARLIVHQYHQQMLHFCVVVQLVGLVAFSFLAQSSGCRIFTGLTDQTVNGITVNDSSSLGNAVGFQFSAPRGDATWQIVARNGSNPITIQDTGLPFIVNEMYDFYLYCPISGTAIGWRIDSVLGQLSFSGSISGTLPTATTAMRFGTSMNGNGVSHQIIFQELYCESHR